ncbi:MAG: protein-export chaperone SecB [Burkholderiales bacterium]|jgi:preprotein translocase subunit SecB|nr:protein-export chaperone SecB [Burkholderiales bacterium]
MSEQQQPQFGIEKIYLKDLSLEIPNAPQVFLERDTPQIEINVHNGAGPLEQPGLYEAVLTVTVTAKLKDKTAFLVEVAQAGIFQIVNLPPQELDAVLGVLCPGTLLPYAREAVASLITRAGFPPVLLQHMNFDAAYQERVRQLQQEQAAKVGAPT